ncbi:MAG: type II toxin-antitoxin system HicB family antitoxin [Actinomycetota bacterium]|nr:type II toxin-antitoxin system HicB family antitoxin [Actinomycetota bacterium]
MPMDITPYVDRLRVDLAQAAASGSAETRDAAERLALALDPAMRLTLMEALSQASAEITSGMRSGSVEVRLAGRDLDFVVEQPAHTNAAPAADPATADTDADDEGATARITLRLPESVKTRAEELAAKHGQSLNTWIVAILRAATRDHAMTVDIDLSSIPFLDGEFPGGRNRRSTGRTGRRMNGWI